MKHFLKNLSLLLLVVNFVTFSSCKKDTEKDDTIIVNTSDDNYSSWMTLNVNNTGNITLEADGDDDNGQFSLWTVTQFPDTVHKSLRVTIYDTSIGTHEYDESGPIDFGIDYTDANGTFHILQGTFTINTLDTAALNITGNLDIVVAKITDINDQTSIKGTFDIDYEKIL